MIEKNYTSRQRIKAVLDHKRPDRIPIDFGTTTATGSMTIAYNRLKKMLGINTGLAKMQNIIMQLAFPEKEVIERFHIDVLDAGQNFLKETSDWKEWVLNDGSKCLIPKYLNVEMDQDNNVFLYDKNRFLLGKKTKNSLYIEQVFWPYGDLPSIPEVFKEEDLVKFTWAQAPQLPWHLNIWDDRQFEIFCKGIKEIHENTDYAIMLLVGCNLFEIGTFLRGMENFFIDIASSKKDVKRLMDKLTEGYLKMLERLIGGVGLYIDVVEFADDLGGMNSPFISPDVFRQLFKPGYIKANNYVHENSNIKIFFHCCGSIYELIPDIIDSGFDILNPVQTTARNMEPERLKKEFGKDIIFWGGGCDTRRILPYGTISEIREDVKKNIAILGEEGGMIFAQQHNIMSDVPPENIIAMFDAAYEFGRY